MILKLNNEGKRVIELQQILRELGYFKHPTNTGHFGLITKQSVIAFQKDNGLKDDGIVGPKTWALLLKSKQIKIEPIYKTNNKNEDFSDPEEEITVDDIDESQPTCSNIIELINLINKSNITRKITKLVFHCTASHQTATVEAIIKYWKKKGWTNPGYHIIVKPDGSWTQLQDFNRITNGVSGINATSLHISYIGGIDAKGKAFDNRTIDQKEIFETIYYTFKTKLPNITFHGHNEFSNKSCPSYIVKDWITELNSLQSTL